MLSEETIDRLDSLEASGFPVLSVYLKIDPSRSGQRSIPARLKDLLRPVDASAASLDDRAQSRSLLADVVRLVDFHGNFGAGRGAAIFASHGSGFLEQVALPAPVRDRAIVSDRPYTRPLRAMARELHRFCAVVLDRRIAEIFRFQLGRLSDRQRLTEEELRKDNYGGFAGYAERRVRTHATEVARRHVRAVAEHIFDLARRGSFDLLIVGGQSEAIEALSAELHADLARRLAGTFSVDLHTMTPAKVRQHCVRVVAEYDAREQNALVNGLLDEAAAGGRAVAGIRQVLAASNQRAVGLLAIDADSAVPGWRCLDCAALSQEECCPTCMGDVVAIADLIDAVGSDTEAAGGAVRHIYTDTPLARHHLGAMLRFGPIG